MFTSLSFFFSFMLLPVDVDVDQYMCIYTLETEVRFYDPLHANDVNCHFAMLFIKRKSPGTLLIIIPYL